MIDDRKRRGVALIMVLIVLSALAIIAGPFAASMMLHERSSRSFEASVKARLAAEAARNHAIARLTKTHRAIESDLEAADLEAIRPQEPGGRSTYQPARPSTTSSRQTGWKRRGRVSLVRRADLGEGPTERRGSRSRLRDASGRSVTRVDESADPRLLASEKEASKKVWDPPSDLDASFPGSVATGDGDDPEASISFATRELWSRAEVEDEQGKINLNSAPPNLIANLLGSSRLARPLEPGATSMTLESASAFRADLDERSMDGAVVVIDLLTSRVEAMTYRWRRGSELGGLFRGSFFSIPSQKSIPAGSFVYDLRGWKVGHHQLRAGSEGGFAPTRLAEFTTVEGLREIASWQTASLFMVLFRAEGLTLEFLQKSGISLRKVEELGLDPAIFGGDAYAKDPAVKVEYDTAVKSLKKARVPSAVIESLRKSRGERAVVAFEARAGALKPAEVKKAVDDLKKSLALEKRNPPRFNRKYLEDAIADMAEAFRTPGVETLLPEEIESLRDAVTVSSTVPAKWSEAQSNPDRLPSGPAGDESFRAARPGEIGGGALLQICPRSSPKDVEFNRVSYSRVNGYKLAYPLLRSYGPQEAWIRALCRHPVNVNSASERVLGAVFTGIQGYRSKGQDHAPPAVSPAQAASLASFLKSKVPIKGLNELRDHIYAAAQDGIFDSELVEPVLLNCINPNDPALKTSTTGLCFATGDVYTIESAGAVRSAAGGLVSGKRLREVVEVSSAEPLHLGLFTQFDFTHELFLADPYTPFWPEDHSQAVGFPGVRGNLVFSRPIILAGGFEASSGTKNIPVRFPIASSDLGTLCLANAESSKNRSTFGDIYHFRGTDKGVELGPGEPFVLDISLSGESGSGASGSSAASGITIVGAGSSGTGVLDLTNMPAAVDFWVRFRTYPEAVGSDGMPVLIDAGAEEERNRICLLYDRSRSEFVARIYDSSLPDPSIPDGKQFLEVRARRPLNLETWYHLRLAWDGTYAGGLQLFIDGLPAGTASFVTELVADLPAQGTGALSLKDRSALPARQGDTIAVRVGNEIIEIEGGSQIRRRPASAYRTWLDTQIARLAAAAVAQQGQAPQTGLPTGASGTASADEEVMRGPYNQRASAPSLHRAGTPVEIHGFSIGLARKITPLPNQTNVYEHQASGSEVVWAPCGLQLAQDPLNQHNALLPWGQYPPEVQSIVHLVRRDFTTQVGTPGAGTPAGTASTAAAATASAENYVVPLFRLYNLTNNGQGVVPEDAVTRIQEIVQGVTAMLRQAGVPEAGITQMLQLMTFYSAEILWAGQTYNAADFFQQEGILWIAPELHYQKEQLPQDHPSTTPNTTADVLRYIQSLIQPPTPERPVGRFTPFRMDVVAKEQRLGLRAVAWGPISRSAAPTKPFLNVNYRRHIRPISVLATGSAASRLYPPSGVLEVRGSPVLWCDPPRPDLRSAPLFGNHPDDTVEWIRYVSIYQDRMFVGRLNSNSNHRGYPVGQDAYKNQMIHAAGEPLRLVMELKEGGVGYGDYVSIVTDDSSTCEPIVRRVYNVIERSIEGGRADGRFFVSLVDVDSSGQETMGVVPYKNIYTAAQNPRLVKFPSGALPQIGTGRMVLFGSAGTSGTAGAMGGGGSIGRSSIEEEITSGTVLDEVRRSYNASVPVAVGKGPILKYVLVPTEGGSVNVVQTGAGLASITGAITEGEQMSRQSPFEVLIVAIPKPGYNSVPFARGFERGLLRIGEEIFAFENPSVGQGNQRNQVSQRGSITWAQWQTEQAAQVPQASQVYYSGRRLPQERSLRCTSSNVTGLGNIEKEGFMRIQDTTDELRDHCEIFYYRSYSGNRFEGCLRGQFQTPIVLAGISLAGPQQVQQQQRQVVEHPIENVTTRLRLIGRACLGSRAKAHALGDPVSLVPYLDYAEITGPLTDTGIAVKDANGFPSLGYILLDPARPGLTSFEIMAYRGVGDGMFRRPQDEEGKGMLRACFGTVQRPVSPGMFAYGMPFRHFDRYEPETEGEGLAYLQKSFRVPGALWRSIRWRERRPRAGINRLCDIVMAARVDGEPDWSEKPMNAKGGLFLFERKGDDPMPEGPIGLRGDELEVRIYFRYKNGSFQRVSDEIFRDDWKETPVLDWLSVEYEKAGRIVRHEEPAF
jgi:hypothetical protein